MFTPLDSLDVDDVPDVASRAVRRFRLHVVLFTVAAVVGAVLLTSWGVVAVVHSRDHFDREELLSAPQWAIAEDITGASCATPSYQVGTSEVTLLQAAPMSGGLWALHFVIDGNGHPLIVQRHTSDGGSFRSSTSLVPVGGGTQGQIIGPRGATWGEAYVSARATENDELSINVIDTHYDDAGAVTVDLSQVLCQP